MKHEIERTYGLVDASGHHGRNSHHWWSNCSCGWFHAAATKEGAAQNEQRHLEDVSEV